MMCKCGSGMSKAMCNCGANKGTRGSMKKGINWAKLTSRALATGADAVRDNASKANRAVGYYSLKPGPRPPKSRVTTNFYGGGPAFPAAYLSDAQAKAISRLANRAYDFGENTLARRADDLAPDVLPNSRVRNFNNNVDLILPLAASAGIGLLAYRNQNRKKPQSGSSRGVVKHMSKSSRNKYGT